MSRLVFMTNPWPSGVIRGHQIAARIRGSVVDPDEVTSDDTCVLIKMFPGGNLVDAVKRCYVDIVDSIAALKHCLDSPGLPVISIGKTAHEYISQYLKRDDVILIPEHHCNFSNHVRDRVKVERVGFCGDQNCFHIPFGEVSEALASIDVEFVYETTVDSRACVCKFYESIDISLCFRRDSDLFEPRLKNPLKLANAGSFRIPTVAYPEINYVEEWGGCFARAENLDDIVKQVKILKESKVAYESLAGLAYEKSKEYRIDDIVPLYRSLLA